MLPPIRNARRQRTAAQALLLRVGITPQQAVRTPAKLSGGQRQRVAIARALVSRPTVLFLDEPTSALDVSVQASLMKLLRDLQVEQHLTILMVTHDLGLARQFADRIALLDRGRVVEEGAAENLLTAPATMLARNLIDAARTLLPEQVVGMAKQQV
jgi:ABC-type dipeptide/oligopeptide/nickel transport system ATPase subunit